MTDDNVKDLAEWVARIPPTDEAYSTVANRLAEGYRRQTARLSAVEAERDQLIKAIGIVEQQRDDFRALSEGLQRGCDFGLL